MGLLETLVLGSYLFGAGAYIYTWRVERRFSNHYNARMKALETRVTKLEKS